MNTVRPSPPMTPAEIDPGRKRRLILGVTVWISGWVLGVLLVPLVERSGISGGLQSMLNGILLLGFPKLFLIVAVAIMGKPGFAYLKSLIASRFRRLAPPAVVGPLRFRVGLILFVALIALGSIGPYLAADAMPLLQANHRAVAAAGDVLLLVSLFVLGGDFWDKLRALFVQEAKVVFPPR